jgi:hypothetical protein
VIVGGWEGVNQITSYQANYFSELVPWIEFEVPFPSGVVAISVYMTCKVQLLSIYSLYYRLKQAPVEGYHRQGEIILRFMKQPAQCGADLKSAGRDQSRSDL